MIWGILGSFWHIGAASEFPAAIFLTTSWLSLSHINLDLSNLPDIQSSQEYILKVLAYNAYSYENGSEIENLPLIAETESKFDQNGNVNVSFEVEIGCKIILVAKLYQIIDGKESITPLYVGNSDVIKIKTSENKVHIILKKQQLKLKSIRLLRLSKKTIWTAFLPRPVPRQLTLPNPL